MGTKSTFEEVLMPSGVSFPSNETELLSDLTLAFIYGLSTGICRPQYGGRLLRSLALKHYWLWELLRKAGGRREKPLTEVAQAEWAEFENMARNIEESLPLD